MAGHLGGEVSNSSIVGKHMKEARSKELPAALCWQDSCLKWGPLEGPGSLMLLVVSYLDHPLPHSLALSSHILLPAGLVSADKESATHILTRKGNGNLLGIIIGGAREILDARPGSYRLVLRKRKGFIKLALTHGYGTSGTAFGVQFEVGKDYILVRKEQRPSEILMWLGDSWSIHNEDYILVFRAQEVDVFPKTDTRAETNRIWKNEFGNIWERCYPALD